MPSRERREKMHKRGERDADELWEQAGQLNRQRSPKKEPGERYKVGAYCHAIAKACEVAFGMPAEFHEPRGKIAREAESQLAPEIQQKRPGGP